MDGLGGPAFTGDLVVDAGRIIEIGTDALARFDAEQVIDAGGRVVAPGFIDPHSHGDPFTTPMFENFLAMGVTTITLGQDGSSPETEDLSDWLDRVSGSGIGPNLAMFAGHGTLRTVSGIGMDPRPSATAISELAERLDTALDVAFGMSTGLEYNPGLHASAAELEALARVVGRRDRVIMSHLRTEDDDKLADAIGELVEQGAHARVHIAHLKSVYGKGSARAKEILDILASARDGGVTITADTYPYSASYTGIGLLFPVWAKTTEQFLEAKSERRKELADYLRQRVNLRNGPQATLLGTAPYTGKTLADLSRELELPFEEVLIEKLGPQGFSAAYFVMDEALQSALLADPWVVISSDGGPGTYHPRGYGTFAKVIEDYVMSQKLLSLETAVAKMTSIPADILGIADRGRLESGMVADVILFDPQRVRARASYTQPQILAEGFDLVMVNGRIVRRDGAMTGVVSGRVLRPAASG
ncbi:MAG: amidohydrolase family protein [Pseudomonadales bacterium]|nr:amidohydrolase family protein [Pseudomonadales bacterium]